MKTRTARGIPMSFGEFAWKEIALESLIGGAFTALGSFLALRYLIRHIEKKSR
jgi:hypothetical protein